MDHRQDLSTLLRQIATRVADRLTLWETIINNLKPETVLELGVWRGEIVRPISFPTVRLSSVITCSDPWRSLPAWNKPFNVELSVFEDSYRAAINATRFAAERVVVMRGTTTEVIDRIPDHSLDLTYVDGDHTLRGITIDLVNVFPKVRADGYITGDDFLPSIWQQSTKYEPTLIFPLALYFAEAHRLPIYALPHGQFLMQKSAETIGYSFTDLEGTYGKRDELFAPRLTWQADPKTRTAGFDGKLTAITKKSCDR